jgi:lysophospholipase L1-like esterase
MVLPAPVLIVQGRRLRRDTPRLPDAAQPWRGTLAGPDPLRLLVLGDSTAAGVGADTQDDGLPGNLARELSARTGRGVSWRAVGRNGATSRDLIADYLDDATAESVDIVFLSIGANDALGLRARRAFGRDIRTLLTRLREVSPVVLVSSLPAFFRFELLPNPLRWNLYLHSQSLEDAARAVVAATPGVHMSPPPPPYTEGFFATDLFHPSATGYRDWARFAIDDAVAAGAL